MKEDRERGKKIGKKSDGKQGINKDSEKNRVAERKIKENNNREKRRKSREKQKKTAFYLHNNI